MSVDTTWAILEDRIGYEFADRQLLRQALTHASGADHRLMSNERLEFLGDAILGAFVCETLFRRYPDHLEGDLTRVKSVVVSRQTCSKLSEELGLDEFLILGKGIRPNRIPLSVMADAFEALIAAIFLDGGPEVAREFVGRMVEPELRRAAAAAGENYKSILQHVAQRDHGGTPVYRVTDERGPDHQKSFQVRAIIGGRNFEAAWGQSKKEAEQRAAMNALSELAEPLLDDPEDEACSSSSASGPRRRTMVHAAESDRGGASLEACETAGGPHQEADRESDPRPPLGRLTSIRARLERDAAHGGGPSSEDPHEPPA